MNKASLHKKFMRMAIEEAKKGKGRVSPNPAVGCIVVKDGRVIARGCHKRFGAPHAEAVALKKAGIRARGSSIYVTLEPCCYFGKTPPCTGAIISSGAKEVISAMTDPNPANSGRGFDILRREGIKVTTGILKKEAMALNRPFIDRMKRRRPYITLKLAQSLDGKIATKTGDSRWISSEQSRALVQRLRSRHDAVMAGVNTVLKDDPALNLRRSSPSGRLRTPFGVAAHSLVARRSFKNPVKIIVDGKLKTPANARVFKDPSPRVIIAATKKASQRKEKALAAKGAKVLRVSDESGMINLRELMEKLSAMGITSILAEGGGELAASLLKEELVDKLILFIAPILIGGRKAVTSFEGEGAKSIRDALRLKDIEMKRIGKDFLIEACLQG